MNHGMNNSLPVVSVCVVTYNQAAYIEKCLLSVLGQEVDFPIEILVGDDASTDETRHIIERIVNRFPDRLRVITAAKNQGASANYQQLVRITKGEFIAHLDGDDYWLAGKLAAQVSFLKSHEDCAAVYSNAIAVNEQGETIGRFFDESPAIIDLGYLLRRGNYLPHCSLVYRSMHRNIVIDANPPFLDYSLHLGFGRCGQLAVLSQPYAVYRVGAPLSAVATQTALTLRLYWNAIEGCNGIANEKSIHRAKARFLSGCFAYLSHKKPGISVIQWIRTVLKSLPNKKIRLLAFAIFAVVGRKISQIIDSLKQPKGQRILYRTPRP
ncbi:glycosyltransferase [Geothrix campi]|uniref:glycosyltransferase n=1 Tax=Geothrix campi TaxID=2966450 RepID=UPI0021481C62|nr:glycosyltransferase [Geothrix sp. SG10]